MDKENTVGVMVESILGSIKMIKKMDMESINGQMVKNLEECGRREFNMEKGFI